MQKFVLKSAFFSAVLLQAACGGGAGVPTNQNANAVQPDEVSANSDVATVDTTGVTEFSVISSRIYDVPVDAEGRFELTATESPANFSLEWQVQRKQDQSRYYATLYLSRDERLDPADYKIHSVNCGPNNNGGCGDEVSWLCEFDQSDFIRCLDQSRDDIRFIESYLRGSGDWPWSGHLIVEFCDGYNKGCLEGESFPIVFNKASLTVSDKTVILGETGFQGGTLEDGYGVHKIDAINFSGVKNRLNAFVLESNKFDQPLTLAWTEEENKCIVLELYLSTDLRLSSNDKKIFDEQYCSRDEKLTKIVLDPLNRLNFGIEGDSAHLSDYLNNNGRMPWNGWLIANFSYSIAINNITRAVPLSMWY